MTSNDEGNWYKYTVGRFIEGGIYRRL